MLLSLQQHQPPFPQHNVGSSTSHHPKAMTEPYLHHSSCSYGLITPPSEMRSNVGLSEAENAALSQAAATNILAPPSASRYNLRKPPHTQPAQLPSVNGTYQQMSYGSYLQQARRRSLNNTTFTSTAAPSDELAQPVSTRLEIDSRHFNVGEFTAAVCS